MTRTHTFKKNAINIYHFFLMVLDDLNNDYTQTQVLPYKCKIPNGNLIYDGISVYSYGVKILTTENYQFIINAESLPEDKKKLKGKILKHLIELIDTLRMEEYTNYIIKLNVNKDYYFDWLLENIKITKLVNSKEQCSIDLEEYDTLVKTACGHLFNDKNLYTWLNLKDTCPLCRTILFDI